MADGGVSTWPRSSVTYCDCGVHGWRLWVQRACARVRRARCRQGAQVVVAQVEDAPLGSSPCFVYWTTLVAASG